jgi:hypothetical protein
METVAWERKKRRNRSITSVWRTRVRSLSLIISLADSALRNTISFHFCSPDRRKDNELVLRTHKTGLQQIKQKSVETFALLKQKLNERKNSFERPKEGRFIGIRPLLFLLKMSILLDRRFGKVRYGTVRITVLRMLRWGVYVRAAVQKSTSSYGIFHCRFNFWGEKLARIHYAKSEYFTTVFVFSGLPTE